MTIPISQVKAICTANELALVQASRRPLLSHHTLAEARRYAVRTRKHFDKWQERVRAQSRDRGRTTGHAGIENRSSQKEQIFRDALDALESQVARLEAREAAKSASPGSRSRSAETPKQTRNRQHRAERAQVRAQVRGQLNEAATTRNSRSRPAAAKATPAESAPVESSSPTLTPQKTTGRSPRNSVAVPKPGSLPPDDSLPPRRQLKARSVAKQNRIAESGLTTRVRGHVSARGRRSQGRKDST